MNNGIDFLMNNACPSIRFRVLKEILNMSFDSDEMVYFQGQILQDEAVKAILDKQQPNGWIGREFHGDDGVETYIRLLHEKGVNTENKAFLKALNSIRGEDTSFADSFLRVGRILDEKCLGGSYLLRAVLFAYVGMENEGFVQEQIQNSLSAFRSVLNICSFDEIADKYKDKLVFKPGVRFPCIYDLRLLAFTHTWRTDETLSMVSASINRLVELSPIPYIHVKEKSQLIAPAAVFMNDFKIELDELNDKSWFVWLHLAELISRLGVIKSLPHWSDQVDTLADMLERDNGKFIKPLKHYYFTKWSPYTGLALENSWRNPSNRICDLTFRSLLILKYAERLII